MKKRLAAIGISKPSGKGFNINSESADKPHLIQHKTGIKRCSVCGKAVSDPFITCVNCGIQFV